MPLEIGETDSQLTGSTASGFTSVVGGVYYGSGNVGSLPAYVQAFQVDPSGSLFITATGSLAVHIDSQVKVSNFPATQNVSGTVTAEIGNWPAIFGVSSSSPSGFWFAGTSGVSGTVQVYTSGPQAVSGSVALTNWPAVIGVSSSSPSGFWSTGPMAVSGTVSVTGTDVFGTMHPLRVDGFGNQVTVTLDEAVALGLMSGTLSIVSVGRAVTGSTSFVALLDTTYNQPSTSAQRSVSSTSASDAAAGTGCRQIKITFYDQNVNGPFTETIMLNGVTAVNTVSTNVCFIEKIEAMAVGTNKKNVGVITLFNATAGGGGTLATFNPSNFTENQTLWAHHYVRPGHTAYVRWWQNRNDQGVAAPTQDVTLYRLTVQDPTNANSPIKEIVGEFTDSSIGGPLVAQFIYQVPLAVPGPSRIVVYGLTRGGVSTNLASSFGLTEI
jgi:hypothetical protein